MNYELAKKLKDAGFPQHIGETIGIKGEYYHQGKNVVNVVYLPTLEELIEACGEEIILSGPNVRGEWEAQNRNTGTKFCHAIEGSPLEAVANLWLELKGKR